MANWERKSAYLLREIVKFKTYVDSLKAAQQQKEVIEQEREERAAEKAAREADKENVGGEGVKTTMLEVMPMPPGTSQSA
jgi:hypothetical protein